MRRHVRFLSSALPFVLGCSMAFFLAGRSTAQNPDSEKALREAQRKAQYEERAKLAAQQEAERARAEAEALRKEALAQRDRAVQAETQALQQLELARGAEQEARRQAEVARRQSEDALARTRAEAEKLLYQNRIGLAQNEFQKKAPVPDAERIEHLKRAFQEIDEAKAEMQKKMDMEITELTKRLKILEMQRHKLMEDFDQKKAALKRRVALEAGQAKPAPSGDKLDLILQRLSSIEERLQRLERNPSR